MKYPALSDDQIAMYSSQFKDMGILQLMWIIEDCQTRIGSHYVTSETINKDYMDKQRDIARLATSYI